MRRPQGELHRVGDPVGLVLQVDPAVRLHQQRRAVRAADREARADRGHRAPGEPEIGGCLHDDVEVAGLERAAGVLGADVADGAGAGPVVPGEVEGPVRRGGDERAAAEVAQLLGYHPGDLREAPAVVERGVHHRVLVVRGLLHEHRVDGAVRRHRDGGVERPRRPGEPDRPAEAQPAVGGPGEPDAAGSPSRPRRRGGRCCPRPPPGATFWPRQYRLTLVAGRRAGLLAAPAAGLAARPRCWPGRGAGAPACAGNGTRAVVRLRASAPNSAAPAVKRYRMRPPSLAGPCRAVRSPGFRASPGPAAGAPLGYGGPAGITKGS